MTTRRGRGTSLGSGDEPLDNHSFFTLLTACMIGLCSLGLIPGCDGTPTWVLDGSSENDANLPRPDVGPYPDGSITTFADLSIAGCAEVSIATDAYHCVGQVPLVIRFSALVPPDTESFVWDFGDGTAPSTSPSPSHRYERPGAFHVILVVGGPFGTLSPSRLVQVTVTSAPLGSYCARDEQCGSGSCLCAESEPDCPGVLMGTCTAACEECAPPAVCADLGSVDATELPDWRNRHCLPGCISSADCARDGFFCREVPSWAPETPRSWEGACLPELLSDVGEGCTGGGGALDPAQCLSGSCLAAGRFGLCTDDCELGGCPSYAACAVFSGGPRADEALCLSRCTPSHPCDGDPDLACEAPSPDGEWGFAVLSSGEPAGATYCAPRRCSSPIHCPSGDCNLATGGFCESPM